ncbi:MAG: polysaccharide pyruvyl transferase family protein [Chitinophagaceae bacterium]
MERKRFLQQAAILSTASLLAPLITNSTGKKKPVIMVVSGWQDVNIGDIAHTPGLLTLLNHRIPGAQIILWKKSESKRVDEMLLLHFPWIKIIHGQFDKDLVPQTEEVKQAFKDADFFIHGSGPSVVAADHLRCWYQQTKKGFGIFGVTIQEVTPALKELLQKSDFIFTRETASIDVLRKNGLEGKHIAFAPDATFVLDIHDKVKAGAFLKTHQLEKRRFICAIPRLRFTPYYKINPNRSGWSDEKIKQVDTVNDQFKEVDHAKLREAMITWVRKTGNKVLVCPEMTYAVDIMDELLIDPLPADVKPFIVKHDYWMPDEAASIYAQAHTILSFECHSPIIAAANGTPCFYLRQPTDTIKGQMYYDLGFNDWVFEMNDTSALQITNRLMEVYNNYPLALKTVKEAIAKVNRQYDHTFAIIKNADDIFA